MGLNIAKNKFVLSIFDIYKIKYNIYIIIFYKKAIKKEGEPSSIINNLYLNLFFILF
jgi:hypothetical protein